jgi:hypothetical protein
MDRRDGKKINPSSITAAYVQENNVGPAVLANGTSSSPLSYLEKEILGDLKAGALMRVQGLLKFHISVLKC